MKTGMVLASCVAVWGWAEWQNWRWSRQLTRPIGAGTRAVVVLGYRNPTPTANAVNRWRADIALRSLSGRQDDLVVVCGGDTSGDGITEARKTATYLRATGYTGDLVVEEDSRTTWENVTNIVPLIADRDVIVFASQPAHALKARSYLSRQQPNLADRLGTGADYRVLEKPFMKCVLAVRGRRTLAHVTKTTGTWGRHIARYTRHARSLPHQRTHLVR